MHGIEHDGICHVKHLPGALQKTGMTSKYKSVSHEAGKWRAHMRLPHAGLKDNKIHIGLFQTEEDAAAAVDRFLVYVNGRSALLSELETKSLPIPSKLVRLRDYQ